MTGTEYRRLSAAIQTPAAGIGSPAAFSSSRIDRTDAPNEWRKEAA